MTETQVILRIEKGILEELDRYLPTYGFKTRNEWFRTKVREFIEESKKRRMLEKLDKLTVDDITEEEIAQMVRDWRKRKAKY
ncbi:MAG: hypothetical protein WC974_06435 [Thermoplasmata archaeon]